MLLTIAGAVTFGIGAYTMIWSVLDVQAKPLARIAAFIVASCVALCGIYSISSTVVCL